MTVTELEKFIRENEAEIDRAAKEALGEELPVLTEELFALFETTGNRLRYETVYFGRRKSLAILGLKVMRELEAGRDPGIYSDRLADVMLDICGEECWALPAHVNRQADPDWRVTVDLFASETAQTLAELTDRAGAYLPETVRRCVREQVERRVFGPYFGSTPPYSWENRTSNWNAVCAGSIGSACLHLMREDKARLEACLARILKALPLYISGFAEDGACMEGIAYYGYGMTFFVNFAQELYEATDGKQDLFCGAWGDFDKRLLIAQFPAKCFFADGNCVSFSDGDSKEPFRIGISSVQALHYSVDTAFLPLSRIFPKMERAARLHDDPCYRFAALKMSLLYTRKLLCALRGTESMGSETPGAGSMESGAPGADNMGCRVPGTGSIAGEAPGAGSAGNFHILPSAQWCIGNSVSGVGFACKGGHNAEPHNHNDVGHFIYEFQGTSFLTDLGAGEYTKEYFSKEGRYHVLGNSSFGHSVPVVGGQGQCAGKEYACSAFAAKEDGSVRMELSAAYPKGALERFEREFRFDRLSGRLTVRDTFRLPKGKEASGVQESLITQVRPEIKDGRILLTDGEKRCAVTVIRKEGEIGVEEKEHSNHQGEKEKVYVIRWLVPVTEAGEAVCEFTAEILPPGRKER